MEDAELGTPIYSSSTASLYHPFGGDSAEPARKKRCIRFSSDVSAEDPSLVSDSGFGDLGTGSKYGDEHGDLEVGSFFGVDLSDLPDPHAEIDILESVEEKNNPESVLNSSVLSGCSSDPSDPCCSNSSGSNSRSSSSASGGSGNQSSSTSSSDDSWESIIFQNKEIADSPSKSLMMQKFLAHLRNNPNDSQLHSFFQLLLAGPEFSPPRQRLRHVTHMSDVMRLFRCSKRILVLTGAGISVSCGIPDFRSKNGLYARVSKVFPHLPDPQSVFDIRLFRRDPRPFFLTAKELYPGMFEPSLAHKFIRKLESRGQLLRNYSQNIDTLETIAGIKNVTMCHGSFATATCIRCKYRVDAEAIKEKALKGEVPFCPKCSTLEETSQIKFPIGPPQSQPAQIGPCRRPVFDDDEECPLPPITGPLLIPPVMKPDIVFFGEDLPDEFHNNLEMDKPECDLLLVIGSSLRVRPVSLIPGMLPPGVPQILINRESLSHCRFDIELLGNCDDIISQLCRSLGPDFSDLAAMTELQEIDRLPKATGADAGDILEPTSENDIQALKACWEPKVNENISERLPENSYLNWRPRQYVFHGAEVLYDPDEDDDYEEEESSESDSDSSVSSNELRENGTDATIPEADSRIITVPLRESELGPQGEVQPQFEPPAQDKSNN